MNFYYLTISNISKHNTHSMKYCKSGVSPLALDVRAETALLHSKKQMLYTTHFIEYVLKIFLYSHHYRTLSNEKNYLYGRT